MNPFTGILSPFIPWDLNYWITWHSYCWILIIFLVLLYILLVHMGESHMKTSEPYNLKSSLFRWNASLALFSIVGSYVTGREMIHVLTHSGYYDSVCFNDYRRKYWISFWYWLWTWSKVIEFGDTAFLVLRKKPLRFIHVYHHSLTALAAFYVWHKGMPVTRWNITMNFVVHSLMYTYFAVAALGYKIPRWTAIGITLIQIVQMILGVIANSFTVYAHITGIPCNISFPHNHTAALTYISYFILFVQMFYGKYINPASKPSDVDVKLTRKRL